MGIILASESPRRRRLLAEMGYEFRSVVSGADESCTGIYPPHSPLYHARTKASAVAEQFPAELVIGADTVIEFDGEIIGKPCDSADAEAMLIRLSGESHQVVTGVNLRCIERKLDCTFADSTVVRFKPFTLKTIRKYLAKVNVLDKAGAYAIQEYGEMLVEKTDGSLNNVIGFPTEKLAEAFYAFGFGRITTNRAPSL